MDSLLEEEPDQRQPAQQQPAQQPAQQQQQQPAQQQQPDQSETRITTLVSAVILLAWIAGAASYPVPSRARMMAAAVAALLASDVVSAAHCSSPAYTPAVLLSAAFTTSGIMQRATGHPYGVSDEGLPYLLLTVVSGATLLTQPLSPSTSCMNALRRGALHVGTGGLLVSMVASLQSPNVS